MLVLVTLVAALGLAVASRRIFAPPGPVRGRRGRFAAPLLALMIAQGVYAGYTIHTFRGAWLDVTRGNAQDLAEGLQRDLNRVLSYGVETGRLRGVEAPFDRLIETFPTIASVELADADGQALARGAPDAGAGAPAQASELTITLPLGTASAPPQSRGSLIIQLSQAVIASSVLARALDAATVIAVAMVAAIEMLLLLSLLAGRGPTASAIMQDGRDVGRATRPVMFGFLFAWALPLGFLPLFARSLPADGLSLPPNIMIALPISAEMACGLVAALCAPPERPEELARAGIDRIGAERRGHARLPGRRDLAAVHPGSRPGRPGIRLDLDGLAGPGGVAQPGGLSRAQHDGVDRRAVRGASLRRRRRRDADGAAGSACRVRRGSGRAAPAAGRRAAAPAPVQRRRPSLPTLGPA